MHQLLTLTLTATLSFGLSTVSIAPIAVAADNKIVGVKIGLPIAGYQVFPPKRDDDEQRLRVYSFAHVDVQAKIRLSKSKHSLWDVKKVKGEEVKKPSRVVFNKIFTYIDKVAVPKAFRYVPEPVYPNPHYLTVPLIDEKGEQVNGSSHLEGARLPVCDYDFTWSAKPYHWRGVYLAVTNSAYNILDRLRSTSGHPQTWSRSQRFLWLSRSPAPIFFDLE